MLTVTLLDLCAIALWECGAADARDEGRSPSAWTDLEDRHRDLMRGAVRQVWERLAAGDADWNLLVTRVTASTTAMTRIGIRDGVHNDQIRVIWHHLSSETDLARMIADPDAFPKRMFDHSVRVVEKAS